MLRFSRKHPNLRRLLVILQVLALLVLPALPQIKEVPVASADPYPLLG